MAKRLCLLSLALAAVLFVGSTALPGMGRASACEHHDKYDGS